MEEEAPMECPPRRTEETSLMPGDFAEAMTLTQCHDLLAYLQTLR